jgi:hypothetical protein
MIANYVDRVTDTDLSSKDALSTDHYVRCNYAPGMVANDFTSSSATGTLHEAKNSAL